MCDWARFIFLHRITEARRRDRVARKRLTVGPQYVDLCSSEEDSQELFTAKHKKDLYRDRVKPKKCVLIFRCCKQPLTRTQSRLAVATTTTSRPSVACSNCTVR